MLDDLTTRDQRMMFGILTMVHMADSKKQLDSDTETLYSIARKHLCQMATLKWQQVDGLNTVLPYGLRKIDAVRTLTTESTAVLIPFHTQEIMQPGGIYYGQNAVSKNMLDVYKRQCPNRPTKWRIVSTRAAITMKRWESSANTWKPSCRTTVNSPERQEKKH